MRLGKLVPELHCSDIETSLRFYTQVLGFSTLFSRPEERFAYLEREHAQIMVEQSVGRTFVAGELEYPYGRGMNLMIEVSSVDELYSAVQLAGAPIYLAIEDKWYQANESLLGNRQFIVMDPDGYLLRFFQDLGERPAPLSGSN